MGQVSVRLAPDGETVLAKVAANSSITTQALARESGLARNTVRDMLRGQRAPRLANAQAVTAAIHRLACPLPEVDELFDLTAHVTSPVGGALS